MKTQKGITLIALIITIIVMLILVGVSVSVALNTGLFKTAQGAAKNTEAEKANEVKISNGIVNIDGEEIKIDDYISSLSGGSKVTLPEDLSAGDIVAYTPASNYSSTSKFVVSDADTADLQLKGCSGEFYVDDMGEWKIVSIDRTAGTIKLIPKNLIGGTLTLTGAHGYNNGADGLNGICSALCGNETEQYSATAVSITAEDIDSITGYTAKSGTATAISGTTNNYFPIKYLIDEHGMKAEDFSTEEITEGCAAREGITIPPVTIHYSLEFDESNTPISSSIYNGEFRDWITYYDKGYWTTTPYCNPSNGPELVFFDYYFMGEYPYYNSISGEQVFVSDGTKLPRSWYVKPIVTLTPKTQMVEDASKTPQEDLKYWTFSEQ